MIDANRLIGTLDVLWITLDTLRYDVACQTLAGGRTPCLGALLPGGGWERRHSPGSFTYSAHHAMFAGFLPAPTAPGRHPRLFAAHFPGSETTATETFVFNSDNIATGLAARGYYTLCIGGVGFFNKQSPLGSVFSNMFAESHWSPELGVAAPDSTENQVKLAIRRLAEISRDRRVFLFLNVSAIHQPNYYYVPGTIEDNLTTHAAALAYVDRCLPPLFAALQRRGGALCVVCSDHGTAYGEDGYNGHRVAHPVVWTVPYAEFVLPERAE
jgi:hypothetical protein